MAEFLLLSGNIPFSIALAVMVLISILEGISVLMGIGLSEMVDSVLPDIGTNLDVVLDADVDGVNAHSSTGSPASLLSWFRVGEVPILILLIVFLTVFGLAGLILQLTAVKIFGRPLPLLFAVPGVFLAALPMVRFLGGILGKYMPQDETYAVSEQSFIGQVATITMGTAKGTAPAQAKLKDLHGQTHYILVLPDGADETFTTGEKCIIVSRSGAVYRAIANTSEVLADECSS